MLSFLGQGKLLDTYQKFMQDLVLTEISAFQVGASNHLVLSFLGQGKLLDTYQTPMQDSVVTAYQQFRCTNSPDALLFQSGQVASCPFGTSRQDFELG